MCALLLISLILFPLADLSSQHHIPAPVEKETAVALSHYPQLSDTHIRFRFKNNIKKSTMQARPTFWSFFRSRNKRRYVVMISRRFKITNKECNTADLPTDVLIGWFGHELGHIMDYHDRSNANLLAFGWKYLFSPRYVQEAERIADSNAVAHGMEEYILATKNFILNNADISRKYRQRIKKFYLSPEEIMVLVEQKNDTLSNDP